MAGQRIRVPEPERAAGPKIADREQRLWRVLLAGVRRDCSRMLEDGGIEARVRFIRPATRETPARAELEASNWRDAAESESRALWDHETRDLPTHTESRLWLVTGLLLPIWDRLPDHTMRVRRLVTGAGERHIGPARSHSRP